MALALAAQGPYVAWTGKDGIEIRRPNEEKSQMLGPGGAFVSLTALPNGAVLAAWEHTNTIEMQIVR